MDEETQTTINLTSDAFVGLAIMMLERDPSLTEEIVEAALMLAARRIEEDRSAKKGA